MAYEKRQLPVGTTFNMLTILKEVPTEEHGRRYVYCQCECGSKKTVRYDGLKAGRIKSCGCLLSDKNQSQIRQAKITRKKTERLKSQSYIGKRYNKLTVVSLSDVNKPGRWFNVICDCGKRTIVSLTRLKNNHTKSCGCIRRKNSFVHKSEIDGETLIVSGRGTYQRLLTSERSLLHVYESRKAFEHLGIEWSDDFHVHHIDKNKYNNSLDNLHVFPDNKSHKKHHCNMEHQMYVFLKERGLLDEFYEENPNLKLKNVRSLLV